MTIETGSRLPSFTLTADDGATVTDADLAGGPLVVFFYPKADTPGCTNEANDFTAHAEAFAAAGCRVVGVSPDKPAKLAKFKAKHGLAPMLLADEEHALAEDFGVWVEKSMYGKSYMGVERSTFLFDADGKCREVWRKVKVKGHADDVLNKAQAL